MNMQFIAGCVFAVGMLMMTNSLKDPFPATLDSVAATEHQQDDPYEGMTDNERMDGVVYE